MQAANNIAANNIAVLLLNVSSVLNSDLTKQPKPFRLFV